MKIKKSLIIMISITALIFSIFTVKALNYNKKSKAIDFFDKKIVLSHYDTKVYDSENGKKTFSIYHDNNDNEYIYNGEKIIGFLKNISVDVNKMKNFDSNKIDKNKLLSNYEKTANDMLYKITTMNVETDTKMIDDNYKLSYTNYRSDYQELFYTYTKQIDGFDTNDNITISLDLDGNLSSFNAANQGIFDKYDEIKIDRNKVNNFINDRMNSYINEKSDKYKVEYQIINILDGNLVLEIGVGIMKNDSNYSYNSVILYYEI